MLDFPTVVSFALFWSR